MTTNESGKLRRTVVELKSLCKRYGIFSAIENFSLTIDEGEIVSLLGPSGCGKTTTLKLIAGFVEPSAGSIIIDDEDVTGYPAYRRNIGMVFQAYALFPHMTVAKNIEFGLSNVGISPEKRAGRVREMLELVELDGLADRYPKELSGGQQQRVALARAIALRPAVLLLDEPFSNLDARLRVRLRNELRDTIKKVGITTLFVTHDQDEAFSMADRIAVLNAGRMEQLGTAQQIYERPVTRFVAEFIGHCTVLDGVAHGDYFLADNDFSLPLSSPWQGTATLMIRGENVRLSVAGRDWPRFVGKVESAEYAGAFWSMDLIIKGHHFRLNLSAQETLPFKVGDSIDVQFDVGSLRLIRDEK